MFFYYSHKNCHISKIESFEDLTVYQNGLQLAIDLYKKLAHSKEYSLKDQIFRSAVSIPSNIAEGHGRSSTKAYVNHLMIAHGSLMELETQLILSARLDYCSTEESQATLKTTEEIGRMIQGLKRSLNSTDS